MAEMTKVEALKEFFGVPGKPVTNAELMAFLRADRAGYDWAATEAARMLGVKLAVPATAKSA